MQTSSSRSGTHVYHTLVLISTILCSYFQSSVDRMLQRGNASMMVGASSWKDQFVDAFTVQAGECHHSLCNMDISLFQIIVTLALYVLRMVVDLKMAKPQNNVIKAEVVM